MKCCIRENYEILEIKEETIPKLIQELDKSENYLQAEFDDEKDLKELLNLSKINSLNNHSNLWEKSYLSILYPQLTKSHPIKLLILSCKR